MLKIDDFEINLKKNFFKQWIKINDEFTSKRFLLL